MTAGTRPGRRRFGDLPIALTFLAPAVAAAVLLVIWVRFEQRVSEPLVDIDLLRVRGVWTTNLTGFLIGVLGAALVGWTLVPSLRGQPLFAGGNAVALMRSALINGTFGWGTAFVLTRVFRF